MFSENGSPRIEDCILTDNNIPFGTPWTGGGAWFSGGSPWLVDVVIEANAAEGWGGGLYFEGSVPSLLRTTIQNNSAYYADGGGVYLLACPLASFVDCTLFSNSSWEGSCGGLAAESSTITMTGCRVDSNGAYNDHHGGGIGISGSSLWFTDGEITNNFSSDGGGISVGASEVALPCCLMTASWPATQLADPAGSGTATAEACTCASGRAPRRGDAYSTRTRPWWPEARAARSLDRRSSSTARW